MLKKTPTNDEIKKFREDFEKVYFPSSFNFLMAHNGIRPRSLHGVLATTGGGKSTLTKKLISEISENNRVHVWLSEENRTPYIAKVNLNEKQMDNITWTEEVALPKEIKSNLSELCKYLERTIIDSNCDVLFFDNITTSAFYSDRLRPAGQAEAADFIIKCAREYCAIFDAAHTKSDFIDNSNRLMTSEDVRGSKTIVNITEYLYLFQKFIKDKEHYNFIQVTKARGLKSSLAGNFYLLKFDNGTYTRDEVVDFEMVYNIFKERNSFGRKDANTRRKPKQEDGLYIRRKNDWLPD